MAHLWPTPTGTLPLLIGLLLMGTTTAVGRARDLSPATATSTASRDLTCWICWVDGTRHAFLGGTGEHCETAEERAQNGCAACGGTSQCHEEWQEGPCHVDCPNAQHEELLAAYDARDVERMALLLRSDQTRAYLNVERSAIQFFSCTGDDVIGHLPVSLDVATRVEAQLR